MATPVFILANAALHIDDCRTGDTLVLPDGTESHVIGCNVEAGYIWLSHKRERIGADAFSALGARKVLRKAA